MQYVIIGNSIAAVGCIEAIRKLDTHGSITVIGDEPYSAYCRPLISYLLWGKTEAGKMSYRSDSFYTDNNVVQITGTRATAVSPHTKTVTLEDGTIIPYDKLLVATGSRPFLPPVPGADTVQHMYTFMTLADAYAIHQVVGPTKRVLILGAGLIGLKCAEAIVGQVDHVTVVDMAPRILPSVLDAEGSERVQRHMEQHGITFRLNESVAKFTDGYAQLGNGETIPFDIVVMAVGVRPNTELLASTHAIIGKGIVVDDHCRTTEPDIYAAGDCTQCLDISSGNEKVLALLPNAALQGRCAGTNMAGTDATFDNAIPMNAVGLLGLHVITAGTYDGQEIVHATETGYKKLFVRDNKLCGYILVGDTVSRAGIYTSLIRNKTLLDTIDFDLICTNAQMMAFARTDRARSLGGIQ